MHLASSRVATPEAGRHTYEGYGDSSSSSCSSSSSNPSSPRLQVPRPSKDNCSPSLYDEAVEPRLEVGCSSISKETAAKTWRSTSASRDHLWSQGARSSSSAGEGHAELAADPNFFGIGLPDIPEGLGLEWGTGVAAAAGLAASAVTELPSAAASAPLSRPTDLTATSSLSPSEVLSTSLSGIAMGHPGPSSATSDANHTSSSSRLPMQPSSTSSWLPLLGQTSQSAAKSGGQPSIGGEETAAAQAQGSSSSGFRGHQLTPGGAGEASSVEGGSCGPAGSEGGGVAGQGSGEHAADGQEGSGGGSQRLGGASGGGGSGDGGQGDGGKDDRRRGRRPTKFPGPTAAEQEDALKAAEEKAKGTVVSYGVYR